MPANPLRRCFYQVETRFCKRLKAGKGSTCIENRMPVAAWTVNVIVKPVEQLSISITDQFEGNEFRVETKVVSGDLAIDWKTLASFEDLS
ncbi:hypothetical protein Trydic_g3698 [Trypoxylus dichotomus]